MEYAVTKSVLRTHLAPLLRVLVNARCPDEKKKGPKSDPDPVLQKIADEHKLKGQQQPIMTAVFEDDTKVTNGPMMVIGPPGTVKTTTAAIIVKAHSAVHAGCRMLITATTNFALEKYAKEAELSHALNVVRRSYRRRSVTKIHKLEAVWWFLRLLNDMESEHPKYQQHHDVLTKDEWKLIRELRDRLDRGEVQVEVVVDGDVQVLQFKCALVQLLRKIQKDLEPKLLLRAEGILTTIGNLTVDSVLHDLQYSLIIVDEASKLEWSDLWTLVAATKDRSSRLVLVGDPAQLGPSVLLKPHDPAQALLVQRASMGAFAHLLHTGAYCRRELLDICFRAPAALFSFSNQTWYDNKLSFYYDVAEFWSDAGFRDKSQMAIIDTANTETDTTYTSLSNHKEALLALRLVRSLLQKTPGLMPENVAVISMYKRQAALVEQLLSTEFPGVRCLTVDSSQGKQAAFVICLLTRTQEAAKVTAFLDVATRMNVSLTRSTSGTIVCLDTKQMASHSVNWSSFLNHYARTVVTEEQFGGY